MRRAFLFGLASLALTAAAPGEARAPARLMVQADEHSLVLSRQSVVRGAALIQLVNRGEDPHDLRLRRTRGSHAISISETRPGAIAQARVRLRTGRYRLWCSLAGHRARGMRATLRVTRPR
jgi:hypothetical protein